MSVYLTSLYGGNVSSQTGVATVIRVLDQYTYWSDYNIIHSIASLDSVNGSSKVQKSSPKPFFIFKNKIKSNLRKKLWKLSERHLFFSKLYIDKVFFSFSKKTVLKNLQLIRKSEYLIVHDIWTLIYLSKCHPDICSKVIFLSHSDGDMMDFLIRIFPPLNRSDFLDTLSKDYIDAVNKIDSIIALSNFAKENLCSLLSFDSEKINVIYNGFGDVSESIKSDEIEDELVINVTGTVCQRKRQYLLIKAFKNAALLYPKTSMRLNIYGDGPMLSKLIKSDGHSFSDNAKIYFHGYTQSPHQHYKPGELFILPSTTEGLPMAAIEAASKGNILALTHTGGCPELCYRTGGYVLDGKTDSEVEDSILGLLEFYISNNSLRGKAAQKSFEGYRTNFTSQAMCSSYAKWCSNRQIK